MFSFTGRLSRKNFILGSLLPMILIIPLGFFAAFTLVSLDMARQQGRAALEQSAQKQAEINQILEQNGDTSVTQTDSAQVNTPIQ